MKKFVIFTILMLLFGCSDPNNTQFYTDQTKVEERTLYIEGKVFKIDMVETFSTIYHFVGVNVEGGNVLSLDISDPEIFPSIVVGQKYRFYYYDRQYGYVKKYVVKVIKLDE